MSQVIQTQIVGKLYPLRFLHYVVAPVAQEPPTDSRQEQSAIAVGVEEGQDGSHGEKKPSESIIKYLAARITLANTKEAEKLHRMMEKFREQAPVGVAKALCRVTSKEKKAKIN